MTHDERAFTVFSRLRAWYDARTEAIRVGPPASPATLDALAAQLGRGIPDEMRAVYAHHDGTGPLLPKGAWLRSVSEIATTLEEFGPIIDEHFEDGPVSLDAREAHWDLPFHRAWIPFATREAFDVWIDLDPGPNGTRGQVLYPVGEASVEIVAPDVLSFLERWATLLESGTFSWSDDYAQPMFPSDVVARSAPSLRSRPAQPTTAALIDLLRV